MTDQNIHCFIDTLVYASSSFLHLPLIAFIGFVLYLAYRGLSISDQVDHVRGLEYQVNELKAQVIIDNQQLDSITLERANLKDALRASKKTLDALTEEFNLEETKANDALLELDRANRENSKLENKIAELTNKCEMLKLELETCQELVKEQAIDEETFREIIESTIVDHVQRGDLAHTIACELSSEFEFTLVDC